MTASRTISGTRAVPRNAAIRRHTDESNCVAQKRETNHRLSMHRHPQRALVFLASMLAHPAFAQELAPLENVVDFLVSFLTGAFARSVAIVAVAVLGYLGLTGRLRWVVAGSVIVGIALIFGSATIVDAISGSV